MNLSPLLDLFPVFLRLQIICAESFVLSQDEEI